MPARIIRNLECKLTTKEWTARARRLAQIPQEVEREKERIANLNSESKARVGKALEEAGLVAAAVRERVEYRDIECLEVRCEELNTIQLVRQDTKEVVEERPMTRSELQGELNFNEDDDDAPPQIADPAGENAWADEALEAASDASEDGDDGDGDSGG